MEENEENLFSHVINLENIAKLIIHLPNGIKEKAINIFLKNAHRALDRSGSRRLYRSFLKAIAPVLKIIGENRSQEYLIFIINRYPSRRALKDEVQKPTKRTFK